MPGNLTKREALVALRERGISPRLVGAELAAAYVGLGTTAFLEKVEAGVYPTPLPGSRLKLWDLRAIDAAVDRRSKLAASSRGETPEDITRAIDAAS